MSEQSAISKLLKKFSHRMLIDPQYEHLSPLWQRLINYVILRRASIVLFCRPEKEIGSRVCATRTTSYQSKDVLQNVQGHGQYSQAG